jgi:ABC-type sugar transport system substrate-binding protein
MKGANVRLPRPSGATARLLAVLVIAGAALVAAVAAGLASTNGVNPGAVAKAKAVVAAARKPITKFEGPTVSPGAIPKGKKIAIIDIVPAPFINNLDAGDGAATHALGWSTRSYNAKGTPQGIQQAMAAALATKPDGIILNADPIAFMQPQLKQAQKAGVKVVAVTPGLPHGQWVPAKWNVVNTLNYDPGTVGATLGAWVVQNSPTGADVVALTSPEFVDFNDISRDFQNAVKGAGSSFTVDGTVASPVSDLANAQTGVGRLVGLLRKYPKAKYIYTLSESWFPLWLQAAASGGFKDVTALGSDGDVSVPLVKQGKKLVFMGTDSHALSWYAVDAMIRAFNGKPQIHYTIPTRLVDKVNAASIKTPGISYDFDYQSKWKALWGVK